jgi:cell division protein FtsB
MKHIFIIAVLLASPAWGQSYDYIVQSQISGIEADQQSQHEQMEQAQWQMRDEMARMREEMSAQRLQNTIDRANAEDYARYH